MIQDGEATRARIYADVMAASGGGQAPLARDWLLNYTIDGERLPLVDSQGRGIRNVDGWAHTLSITRVERGRYPNRESEPGLWTYPYSVRRDGTIDPSNKKLSQSVRDGVPALYFYKPVRNVYLAIGSVLPIDDFVNRREFVVSLLDGDQLIGGSSSVIERAWASTVVDRRLHQPRFRAIVMAAYESSCSICGLPEATLLDAAHIRGDKDPNGQPVVENGLALCSIHHRAYDNKYVGIDEDLRLHVRPDVLEVSDGPVWEHALQRLPGQTLAVVPRRRNDRPDPYRLGLTFKEFLDAVPR
ncbi:hypothetical protein Lsed01_01643 [Demequina sediminis]|uniref:HNH nuclease domain-containing protein n=1 Tax=Demequina sediminis TaxID=1930058 RepID=A0ABP9WH87_9MICO|nr:HNH endonuclease [Demequina sediminis]BDZ60444.1 hypothetical protein GCM10025873_02350 [Demequina sediminis]